MDKQSLLKPVEFRFTTPEDIEKYGADWYRYDELAICSLSARTLIELETEMDTPLASVMDGFRQDSVFGALAASWLALHMTGKRIPFAEFDPLVMLLEWRIASVVEPGKEPAGGSDPVDSLPPESPRPPTDTVLLPTMPVVGSPS